MQTLEHRADRGGAGSQAEAVLPVGLVGAWSGQRCPRGHEGALRGLGDGGAFVGGS